VSPQRFAPQLCSASVNRYRIQTAIQENTTTINTQKRKKNNNIALLSLLLWIFTLAQPINEHNTIKNTKDESAVRPHPALLSRFTHSFLVQLFVPCALIDRRHETVETVSVTGVWCYCHCCYCDMLFVLIVLLPVHERPSFWPQLRRFP